MDTPMAERVMQLHREASLTDVHVHPSMKAYLFRRNLWRHYRSGKSWNPFATRSDFKMLTKGGVGVVWSALHLPERQLFKDCILAAIASILAMPVYFKIMRGSRFKNLLALMDAMEREVRRRPDKVALARSAADVVRIRQEGKIAVVHTVEGAHALEGDPDNLDVLAQRGVAMITLNHFYFNGLASQVDAIPEDMFIKKVCKFRFGAGGSEGLTDLGRTFVRRMKDLPMLIDICHCTPGAREAIYAEVNAERPIVASHSGVARHNPDPYNLTDDEIREIARSGGVMGVIFMTYWLDKAHPKAGLEAIWRTIEHMHEVTSSWDHIALGTDFDGFTDPPDDLKDASEMGKVTAMLLERGVPEDAVRKILGGNAQRVLEVGWR